MAQDAKHPEFEAAELAWQLVRDCVSGSRAVKKRGRAYLPPLYKQEPAEYEAMLKRAVFFGATGRTLKAFNGFIYRKDPKFKNPSSMDDFMRDCTMTGVSFYDYCKRTSASTLSVGRGGTLIDWDSPANENRPYLVWYDTEDVINWRYERINGRMMLAMLMLYECTGGDEKDDGTLAGTGAASGSGTTDYYQQNKIERWREYRLQVDGDGNTGVVCVMWKLAATGGGAAPAQRFVQDGPQTIPTRRGIPLMEIPFVFHNVNGNFASPSEIPLEDFAELNVAHFRGSADLERARHVCASPTPVFVGVDNAEDVILGPNHAILLPVGGSAEMLQADAQKLSGLTGGQEEKERQMAALGARMLESQGSGAWRAEAFQTVQIRQSGEASALTDITIACTQTLSKVLHWVAWWLGTEDSPNDFVDKVQVELNTEFLVAKIDAPTITAAMGLYLADPPAISWETLFEILKLGDFIPSERTIEEEMAAIQAEVAKRDRKAKDMAAVQAKAAADAAAANPPKPGAPPAGPQPPKPTAKPPPTKA